MSNHKDNSTYKGGRRSQHGHSEWPSLISHDSLPDLGSKTVEELSMTIKLKTRDENISNLLEIFPEVDKDVLNDILEQCGDDVPEATDKVIEILEEGKHRIKQEETDLAIIACSLLSDEATSAKRLNIFSSPAERLQGESDQIGNTGINSHFSNVSPQSLIKVGQESHISSTSPFPMRLKDIGNSAVSSHRVDDSDSNFVKRSEVEVQSSSGAPMIGQSHRTSSSNRRVETRLSVSGDKSKKSSFVNHSSELTECLRGSKLVVSANNYSIGGVKNISGKDCFSSNLHISGPKAQQLESFVHKSDRMHKSNLQEFLSPSNHNIIDESFTEMKKCVNGLRDFSGQSPSKKPSDLINGWDELYEQLDLDPDEIDFVPGNFTNTNVETWRWQAMDSSFTSVNSATVPTVAPKTTPKKRNRRSKKKHNAQRMEVNNLSKENTQPMTENVEEIEENLFYPKETLNIPEAVRFSQNMDQSDMTTKVRNDTEWKSGEANSRNIDMDLSTKDGAHISYIKNLETKINLSPDAAEFHPQPPMAHQQAVKLGQQGLSPVKMKEPSGNLDPQPQTPVAGSPKKKKSGKAKKRERGLSGGLNQQQLAATEANGQREHVQDDHLEEMECYEDPIDPLGWHAILSPRTLGRPQTQKTPEKKKKNTFSTMHQSQQRQMPPWAVGLDSSDVTRSNEGSIRKFSSVSYKTRSQSIISNSSSSSGEWKQDLKKNHFRQKPLASHLISNETHPGPLFGEPVSMLRHSPQKMQSVSSTLASRLPPSLQGKAPPVSSPATPKNPTAESLMSKGQVLCGGAPSIGLNGAVTTNSEILTSSPSETVLFKNKLAFRGVKTPVDVIRLYILEKQPVLVILRGLPGSGKSYLANQLIAEGQKMGTEGVILSTDDYFMQRGIYKFNRNDLGTAHDWNKQRALNYVKQSKSPIIIDNTNTTLWEFLPYAEVALKHKYDVQVFEPDTTWSLKVRELARRNCHGVTKDAIVRMKERYEKISTEDLLKAASSSRRITQVPSAAETTTEEQPESNADQPQDSETPLILRALPMHFSTPLNPPLKPHKGNPPQQQHRLPQHYPLFLQQPALQQQLSPLMRSLHPQQTALQQQPSPLLRSLHPQQPRPQQQLSPLMRPLLLQQPVPRQQLSPLLHPLLPQQPALQSLLSPHLHRLLPQQSAPWQQTSPFQHQLPPQQPSLLQHPLLPQKPAPMQPEAEDHVKTLLWQNPTNQLDDPLGVSHGEDTLASSKGQSLSGPASVCDVLGLSEWFEAKEQRVPKKMKKSGGSSETENKSSGITVEYLSQSLKNAFVNLSDLCKHTAAPTDVQEVCRPMVSEKIDLLSAGEASHVSDVEETRSVSAEPKIEMNTATEEEFVFPDRLEKFICQEDSSCTLNKEDGSEDLGYPVDDQSKTLSEYSALDEAEKGSQLNCSCSTVGSFKSCCSDKETMLSKYGDMDSELDHHEHPSWEVNPEGCLRNGLDVKAAISYFQTEESQNVDTPATIVDVEEFDYRKIQDNESNEDGESSGHQEGIIKKMQKNYSDASASSASESEDEEIVSENDIPLKNSESSLSILDQYFDSSPPLIDQDYKAEVGRTRNQEGNTLSNDVFPASLVDYSDSENENDDKGLGREGERFEGGHRSTPSPDESLSRHYATPLQEADDTCLTESSVPTSKEGSPKLEGNENSDSSPSRRARKKRVKKGRNPGPFIDDSLKVKSKTESWSSFYKQHTDGMRISPVEVTNLELPSPSTEFRSESSQCDSYYFSLLHKLNSSAFNKLQPIDLSLSDVRVISSTWSKGGESSPADTQGSFVSRKSETNDRSTNTDEAIEKEEVDLETLQNCFPEYSRKQLEYTMAICHNNLEWVCSHLLDSPALIDIEEEEEDNSPVQLKRDSSASKLKSLAELCSSVAKQTNQVDQDDLEMQIIEAGETRLQKIETFGWSRIHSYERGRFNGGGFDYFNLEDFRGSPSSEASWDFPPKQMVPQYKTKPPNNISGSSNYDQHSSNEDGLLSKSPGGGEISYAHTPSSKTPGPKRLTTPPPTTPFEYTQDPGVTTSATPVNVPTVPGEFIKCLEHLYGPLNLPVGDEGLPLDDVIARKIYNCLKLQATKKVINNTSDQQLQNDEALARALQEEEDSQEQKKSNHHPLGSGKKIVAGWSNQMPAWMYQGGMTSGLQGHSAPAASPLVTGGGNSKKPKGSQGKKHKPFNLQKRLAAGGIKSVWAGVKRRGQADSLQSIMEEEQAREESQKEQMRLFELTGDTHALATRIKRNKLAELFPSLSPEFLEDIFMNAGYSMEDTVKILSELYNISPAPMSRERQEEIMEEAKERSREEYYSQYIFPEDVYEPYDEDSSPMTYEELRNEAQFYRGLARECQEKASRYQSEGMSGAALFYRQKVKDYKSYESDSNQRAAEVLFEKGKERLTKENTLDLHFYHLEEAVSAVNYAISLKEEESRLRPDRKSTYLNIVTGRGRNSKDGVPILKPAIMNHLRERCLRFEEKSPGMLKVYFSQRM